MRRIVWGSLGFVLLVVVLVFVFICTDMLLERSEDSFVPAAATTTVPVAAANVIKNGPHEGPYKTYFEKSSYPANTSNVVGYFFSGAFYVTLPFWVSDNWKVVDGSLDTTLMVPRDHVIDRDFSDINMIARDSNETFNANWLFENDKTDSGSKVITSEVILADGDNMRLYHIEKSDGDDVADVYYIDGNGKTVVIRFSSAKDTHYYYGAKIKEFVQGFTLARPLNG